MAVAGYKALLSISGTSTSTTGEAMEVVSGKTYQVTAAARRLLDPETTPTVYDDASEVSASNIESIDYLLGRVTFTSGYNIIGDITIDADYLPRLTVAETRSVSWDLSRDALDTTVHQDISGSGYRQFIMGLITGTVSIESLDLLTDDLDGGSGTVVLATLFGGGTAAYLHWRVGNEDNAIAARVLLPSISSSGSVEDLAQSTIECQIAATEAADGTIVGWSSSL